MTTSGILVYLLCMVTSAIAAWLLLRAFRRRGERLLLWSFLCFALLAADSFETFIDYITPPWFDLSLLRTVTSLIAVCTLLYGFIWETD